MKNKTKMNALLAGAVALTMAGGVASANAMDMEGQEKCYGVVKAGHNDCGNAAGTHSCAGQAAVDGDGGEWVGVPAGLCDKLVGGHVEPVASHGLDHEHNDAEADADAEITIETTTEM